MLHIKPYYGEDHKKYSKEEYEIVYKEFAPMLKDQSIENLEIFEILLGDLPDTQLFDDVELLDRGDKEMCSTYDLVISMNEHRYKKEYLTDFLEILIKDGYGIDANYLVFEMYYEMNILNDNDLIDLIINLIDKYNEVDDPYEIGQYLFTTSNWTNEYFAIYYED